MTREEAITILNMVEAHGLADKAKRMAIKALEFDLDKHDEEVIKNTVETLWGEPCEDAISRKWLRNAIHNFYKGLIHTPTEEDIQAYIDVAPSVKPQYTEVEVQKMQEMEQAEIEKAYELGKAEQPKMGRWMDVENEEMETVGYYCSECDLPMETEQRTNFCPNCGCQMVESEEV